MDLISNIKNLCIEKSTSIPKLEKALGFSNGSIYNWDKSSPSADKLVKVADRFNVSVDYLIGRTDKRNATVIEETIGTDNIKIEMDKDYFRKLTPTDVVEIIKALQDAGFDIDKLKK